MAEVVRKHCEMGAANMELVTQICVSSLLAGWNIKLLENAERKAIKVRKGLEGKVCGEQLRSHGVLSAEQRR